MVGCSKAWLLGMRHAGILLALAAVATPRGAAAQEAKAVKGQELQVFLGDKAVGTEVFRSTKGTEAHFHAGEAQLQDKVGKKAWKAFKQRYALQVGLDGKVIQYDRWIDVTGATQQLKLFNYQGQWRISVVEAAFEGKKPKPKVSDVAGGAPLVVVDERAPSLLVAGVDLLGSNQECHYVRVDNATTGKAAVVTEALVDAKGAKYKRVRLHGPGFDVHVLRDGTGKLLQVQGVDGWRAVAKDIKVPKDLVADASAPAAPAPAAPAPAAPAAAAPAQGAKDQGPAAPGKDAPAAPGKDTPAPAKPAPAAGAGQN